MPAGRPLVITAADPGGARVLLSELDAYLDGLYPDFAGTQFDYEQLRPPMGRFAVAHAGAQAAGCAGFRLMDGYGEIKRVYVMPAHARRGVARALLSHLEAQLRQVGLRAARLETGNRQPGAVACFAKLGYRACPPFGDYPANGISLFFEKPLCS